MLSNIMIIRQSYAAVGIANVKCLYMRRSIVCTAWLV